MREIVWNVSEELIDYNVSLEIMKERVELIHKGTVPEMVWLLQHPPLYTAGTSAKPADLIEKNKFPVYETGRGGQYTYHGPGQRVIYVMLDLRNHRQDVRKYVFFLEQWVIQTLSKFNINGQRRSDRVGIWIEKDRPGQVQRDYKIGAIGVRIRRWITSHGISLNISPDLEHFSGIVPCGVTDGGVTSFADLGHSISLDKIDLALKDEFIKIFGGSDKLVLKEEVG